MEASSSKRTQSQPQSCSTTWGTFLKASCDALFQTALLISADCAIAEAGLSAAFEEIDLCRPPRENELAILQSKVATLTLQKLLASPDQKTTESRYLLQSGLWPVLEIDRTSRASFVLHYLLGYSICRCAVLLRMDEAKTREVLQVAVLQLRDAAEAGGHSDVSGTGSK